MTNQKGFGIVELLICLAILMGGVAAGVYVYRSKQNAKSDVSSSVQSNSKAQAAKPTAEQAVNISKDFVKAMQRADKTTVDSLTSPAFKATLKSESGTESFYDQCASGGSGSGSCLTSFKAFDPSKVTVDVIDYSKEAGANGKTVTIHANSKLQGKLVLISYDFHLSPGSSNWQVDDVQETQSSPQ